jgi:hypothetical protein
LYSISGEREWRIGLLAEPDKPPDFDVNFSVLFVADASFILMEANRPKATAIATESLGFVQSDEPSLSSVRDPSLGFRGSDALETVALLLTANPAASAGLGAEGLALCNWAEGLRQSALGDSHGLFQSTPIPNLRLLLTAAPPEGSDHRSREAIESPPTRAEQRSRSSATVGTLVGVCIGVIAAGVSAAGFALARRRCAANDQAAADSSGVKPELDETLQADVDAIPLAKPRASLEHILETNVFVPDLFERLILPVCPHQCGRSLARTDRSGRVQTGMRIFSDKVPFPDRSLPHCREWRNRVCGAML